MFLCLFRSQLACKTDREYRAVEVGELMPSSHTVQLAIKYAGRLRMLQLAGRLGEVARQKAEEEELRSQEEGGALQEVCDAADQLQDQPSKHYKSRYDVTVK